MLGEPEIGLSFKVNELSHVMSGAHWSAAIDIGMNLANRDGSFSMACKLMQPN